MRTFAGIGVVVLLEVAALVLTLGWRRHTRRRRGPADDTRHMTAVLEIEDADAPLPQAGRALPRGVLADLAADPMLGLSEVRLVRHLQPTGAGLPERSQVAASYQGWNNEVARALAAVPGEPFRGPIPARRLTWLELRLALPGSRDAKAVEYAAGPISVRGGGRGGAARTLDKAARSATARLTAAGFGVERLGDREAVAGLAVSSVVEAVAGGVPGQGDRSGAAGSGFEGLLAGLVDGWADRLTRRGGGRAGHGAVDDSALGTGVSDWRNRVGGGEADGGFDDWRTGVGGRPDVRAVRGVGAAPSGAVVSLEARDPQVDPRGGRKPSPGPGDSGISDWLARLGGDADGRDDGAPATDTGGGDFGDRRPRSGGLSGDRAGRGASARTADGSSGDWRPRDPGRSDSRVVVGGFGDLRTRPDGGAAVMADDRSGGRYLDPAVPDLSSATPAGLLIGLDPAHVPVVLGLFRRRGLSVALVGGLAVAQVVVLRAMALGARVVVETARGEEWDPLVLGAGVDGARFVVQGVGQVGAGPWAAGAAAPVLVLRDCGARPPYAAMPQGAWTTVLTLLPYLDGRAAGQLAGADLVGLQRMSGDEAGIARQVLGLAEKDAAALPDLPEHMVLWRVRGRRQYCEVAATRWESGLVGSLVSGA